MSTWQAKDTCELSTHCRCNTVEKQDRNKREETLMAQMSRFPGFRFCPTDVELISYYLKQKMDGSEKSVEVIPEVEICRYEPWDLPGKAVIQSDNEWFFFSPRGRKYPNGSQSKRATECGYWKATGKERSVKSNTNVIGTKRTLVFHLGRAPKGQRTEWIMHEYCMHGSCQDPMVVCRLRKNSEFRLNEESASQRGLSMASKNTNQAAGPPSHHQYSQMSGNDHIDGERANDGSSKKCTSSHDSYSIEQSGDTFESDRKVPHDTSQQHDDGFESDHNVPHDASQPESPCSRKDCDNDDFYAEILNDDIVKLFDESSLTTGQNSQPVISRRTEQHHMRSASPSMVPLQGTARRRIRFDTSKVDLDELEKHLNPLEPQSIVSRLKAASLSSILVLVLLIVAPLVVALLMVSRIQPALLFARIQSKNNK